MEFNEEELRDKDRVMDTILDEAVEIKYRENINDFRLKLNQDHYDKLVKEVKYFSNYRSLSVDGEDQDDVKLYICVGIHFYVSVDNNIDRFQLKRMVNGKKRSHNEDKQIAFKEITKPTEK